MKRIGKILRSLFSRSSAVHDEQDEIRRKVSPPQDMDLPLTLQVINRVEQKRLFLRPGLTVADVAAEMNMEVDVVERIFTRFIGGDFNRYLDELRIAYAAVLFIGHESQLYSIEKIGSRCGFPDNDTFVGVCRKLTGMTPEVMREFSRGRETLKGLFLNPPIYLRSDTLEKEELNTNMLNMNRQMKTSLLTGLLAMFCLLNAGAMHGQIPAVTTKPYCVAVRTNALYDAILLPTLGVEWRINPNVGIKLDGSLSWWGGEHDKVQKMWLLNPEVRWYLLADKRFYVGASGSYGEYNIYKYPLGNMLADDTGYQGKLWNAGLTVGYQLYLSRSLSVDFNLGLGYTRLEYDSFTMMDKVRVYKDRDRTKNFWGPTQAGISLVWTIGSNK